MKQSQSLILFHQKTVRRHWDKDKELWYFSIIDVVQILTDSTIPRRYWSDLKTKLQAEGSEVYEKIVQLKMIAPDGKQRKTDCLSTEDLLRVIQSIPSPKAEPFKLWLAKVGYERIEETAKEVTEGKELAVKTLKSFEEILKAAGNAATMVQQISAATQQMSAGSKQVVKSIDEIASSAEEAASATEQASASTEEMTASMEEMAASAQELANMAIELRELVGKFKTGAEVEKEEVTAKAQKFTKAQKVEVAAPAEAKKPTPAVERLKAVRERIHRDVTERKEV